MKFNDEYYEIEYQEEVKRLEAYEAKQNAEIISRKLGHCWPPIGTKPDTVHALLPINELISDWGEYTANWTGEAWKNLGGINKDLTPEQATAANYKYKIYKLIKDVANVDIANLFTKAKIEKRLDRLLIYCNEKGYK